MVLKPNQDGAARAVPFPVQIGRRTVPFGTEIMHENRTYFLDGEMLNRNPQPCFGCRFENDGPYVYILAEKPQKGNPNGKKLWWCKECVESKIGAFDTVVSAAGAFDTDEGAF